MIPLLSVKAFNEFTPAEFKAHVKLLFFKKEKKGAEIKVKKPFTWNRNKKGTLILRVNRKPKWITEEEFTQIAHESGEPLNLLFLMLKKKEVEVSTQMQQDKIKLAIEQIPF